MKVLKKISWILIITLVVSSMVYAGDVDDPYKKYSVSPIFIQTK